MGLSVWQPRFVLADKSEFGGNARQIPIYNMKYQLLPCRPYTYGPPLAVSPLNEVRRVLDYAVTEIPPEKILMGMPNYGYDWTLPFMRGTPARSIGLSEAVELAQQFGVEIQYDETAQAPFFYYTDNGQQHVVWFDDPRSIEAKLKLIDEYGLAGASYWTVNRCFVPNWLIQQSMYDTVKL